MPWMIDGTDVEVSTVDPLLEEARNWQTLSLTFRVPEATVDSIFRPLDTSVGKFDVVEYADGEYEIEERAGGANIVTLGAPANRSSLRSTTDYAIAGYNEDLVDQPADVWKVSVEFTALSPKAAGSHGTVSATGDEWHFAFADGEIATHRVEAEVQRGGDTVSGDQTLRIVVEASEAQVVEDSLNRQAAVRVREIVDAQDLARDNNSNDRNTVTVTTSSNRDPGGRVIPTDEYVVTDWETSLINEAYFAIRLNLKPRN